jgi:3-deoxy-D-manno-octulosonate 8-phosphate phosphatase (KDO 8-P phosphatase)
MPAAEPRTFAVPDETVRRKAIAVRLMIFDVDGVLTDGRIIYHDDGSELKAYDVQDGHGIKLLLRAGLEVALMSGRYCGAVARRAEGLGIRRVFQNIQHKAGAYAEIKEELGLRDAQVGYMGDDLIDIPVMRRVGFAVTVPNASPHVRPYAHYITQAAGGRGACREVCELLLHSQGLWESVTRRYFHDDFPSEV